MKLKEGFSELDLNGILFVEFPVELSLKESRDRLELMILDAVDAIAPDSDEEPIISPFWVYLAFHIARMKEIEKLTPAQRKRLIAEAWAEREERKKKSLNLPLHNANGNDTISIRANHAQNKEPENG